MTVCISAVVHKDAASEYGFVLISASLIDFFNGFKKKNCYFSLLCENEMVFVYFCR